jgi:Holliday junction resolvase-like predicted endonuclease
MQQIGLWQVTDQGPVRLDSSGIDLEQYLESWIERDPGMLQHGLTIVGRQLALEAGRLDLLALDPQGRWAVIEIKRGTISRETISQALDYAACVARMPYDELVGKATAYLQSKRASLDVLRRQSGDGEDSAARREVGIFVVGTTQDQSLERMVDYLGGYDLPIQVVTYQVFALEGGQRVLLRELTEGDTTAAIPQVERGSSQMNKVEEIRARAERQGIGEEFSLLYEAATRHGLYPRPYRRSIMYTPPQKRNRMLFTVWSDPQNALVQAYIGSEEFAEFNPSISAKEATAILGPEGWRNMTRAEVEGFVRALDQFYERLAQRA